MCPAPWPLPCLAEMSQGEQERIWLDDLPNVDLYSSILKCSWAKQLDLSVMTSGPSTSVCLSDKVHVDLIWSILRIHHARAV